MMELKRNLRYECTILKEIYYNHLNIVSHMKII